MRIQEVGILVVDDVNAIRVQVKQLLKNVGFEKILVASNGVEASKLLEEGEIQVVLCDMHMSPMDGLSLLKYVRSHPKLGEIAFIFVTAEGTREQVVEAIQTGADDYILKPLTVEQIHSKVFKGIIKRKVLQ